MWRGVGAVGRRCVGPRVLGSSRTALGGHAWGASQALWRSLSPMVAVRGCVLGGGGLVVAAFFSLFGGSRARAAWQRRPATA